MQGRPYGSPLPRLFKVIRRLQLLLPLVFLSLFVFSGQEAQGRKGGDIRVFAPSSLADALMEIKDRFEKRTGLEVSLSIGASGDLLRQIEKGAMVDVFISAGSREVDAFELEGLALHGTRQDLLSNRLVVIAPVGSTLKIGSSNDLARGEVKRIALGEPGSVPAGFYAREALKGLGLWEVLYPRLVLAQDVRAVLACVEEGAAEVGIVYKTDAIMSRRARLVYEFPPESYPKITYPAVVLKGSKEVGLAIDFVDFLSSREATEVFGRLGFEILDRVRTPP